MRFQLQAGDPRVLVIYGWDSALSFFLECRSSDGRILSVEFDATTKGDLTSISEVLGQLVQVGLCTHYDIWEAREASQHFEDAEELEDAPDGVKVALTVLLNLRLAASGE